MVELLVDLLDGKDERIAYKKYDDRGIGMGKVFVSNHPLIAHKLTSIRNKDTSTKDFRALVHEVAMLMTYEVTQDLPLADTEVQTPLTLTKGKQLAGKEVVLVPILRAGLGLLEGILKMIPDAKVGHIGLYRDEKTFKPVEYYYKLPTDAAERQVILVDPMLATGGSASAAISFIKQRGVKRISLMCLIAAPEGIKVVQDAHPDVDIYAAALDECLNECAYIVPGLGDAGDRLFGTED